jgi:molybdopterin-guanine dinucleotide biosynthesis protein A
MTDSAHSNLPSNRSAPQTPRGLPDVAQPAGLVLCGGAASRLGGIDKGLLSFHGKALVDIALEAIAPHCSERMISANRNIQQYAERHLRVIPDLKFSLESAYEGPLAGIQAGLAASRVPWLLVVPCDCPRVSQTSLLRLIQTAREQSRPCYLSGQPTFTLLPIDSLASLNHFLGHGQRRLSDWLFELNAVAVEPASMDELHSLNTPDDLRYLAPGL